MIDTTSSRSVGAIIAFTNEYLEQFSDPSQIVFLNSKEEAKAIRRYGHLFSEEAQKNVTFIRSYKLFDICGKIFSNKIREFAKHFCVSDPELLPIVSKTKFINSPTDRFYIGTFSVFIPDPSVKLDSGADFSDVLLSYINDVEAEDSFEMQIFNKTHTENGIKTIKVIPV